MENKTINWIIFIIVLLIIIFASLVILYNSNLKGFLGSGNIKSSSNRIVVVMPIENSGNSQPSSTSARHVLWQRTSNPSPASVQATYYIAQTGSSSSDPNVNIANLAFSPLSITINIGDSVTWTNNDNTAHTVTSDSGNELDSSVLQPGQSYTHTFNSAGTFNYHCTIHPFMTGTITVEGAMPTPTPIPTPTPTPTPAPEPTLAPIYPIIQEIQIIQIPSSQQVRTPATSLRILSSNLPGSNYNIPAEQLPKPDIPSEHFVDINNFAFYLSSKIITQGDSVTWINNDNTPHTVTSDSGGELNSKILQPRQSYTHTFNKVGNFYYHCSLHPSMKGLIIVSETELAPGHIPFLGNQNYPLRG